MPHRLPGIIGLAFLCLVGLIHGAAADESGSAQPVQIEKTFDKGTLISHTLTLVRPPHTVWLHVSQRRISEDADAIAHTDLRFNHKVPEEAAPLTRAEFETLLAVLITAFQEAFGSDLVPESLGAGGFLGVGEMEHSSALAFQDFVPWVDYLENPAAFPQWKIHAIVLARWKAAHVFEPVVAVLARAGYEAELSGFEKLFVFKAEESKIYPELKARGIPAQQKCPYPGTVAFAIKERQ